MSVLLITPKWFWNVQNSTPSRWFCGSCILPRFCDPVKSPSQNCREAHSSCCHSLVYVHENTSNNLQSFSPVYSQARIGYDMFGNASSDFYLDEVQCTGQEDSIFNCTASVDAHDCDIHEPASVSCIRDAPLSSSCKNVQPFQCQSICRLQCEFTENSCCDVETRIHTQNFSFQSLRWKKSQINSQSTHVLVWTGVHGMKLTKRLSSLAHSSSANLGVLQWEYCRKVWQTTWAWPEGGVRHPAGRDHCRLQAVQIHWHQLHYAVHPICGVQHSQRKGTVYPVRKSLVFSAEKKVLRQSNMEK